MTNRANSTSYSFNFLFLKSNAIYLVLSILAGLTYFYFAYPHLFPAFFTHILSDGYGVIDGAIHTGDLLQLIYFGWIEKMNILQGESLLLDRFTFQAPGVPGYRVLEIGPLFIVNALISMWTTQEAAWNFSHVLVPLILGIGFNYLLLKKILKNRLLAVTASLIPMFEMQRLHTHINGHQSGAYYFFIPMTLYFLEFLRQAKSKLKVWNLLLFMAIFGSVAGDISVGYYCALMSVLWLFVRFVFDVSLDKERRSLWFHLRTYCTRYWGLLLSFLASFIFGKLLKNFVLEEGGNKIMRSLHDAAHYSGDFFPIVKGMNSFYGVAFLLVIGLIVFKILFGKRKIQNPNIVFSKEDLACFAAYFLITVFFTLAACGAREPLVTYFPIVKILREILPFFKMQRVYSKMLLVVYLSSLVFLLLPWKAYLQSLKSRKVFAIPFALFFILIMHAQLTDYLDRKRNFNLYTIEKSPFDTFYGYIASHTTEEDIILDLPLLGGQQGYDGKTFDYAMHTGRRFIGGYNTGVPSHYRRIFALSRLYGSSPDLESLVLFKKLGLKYITVDKHAPGFSRSIVKNLSTMPWFDLKYEDNYGVFLETNEKIHRISLDNDDFLKQIPHIIGEGFHPVPETGFGKIGSWMIAREASIIIPNLEKGKNYELHIRLASLNPNRIQLSAGEDVKIFKIHGGLNNLVFPFQAPNYRTKFTIAVGHLVKASDYNPSDHRNLGLFLIGADARAKKP